MNATDPGPRRLKIVRVIARLNVGGPARHVILLNAGLERRGHGTLLVHGSIASGEASLEELATSSAIPTEKIPTLGRRISPLDDARALFRLIRLLFREGPDVLHTHTAKAGTLGRIAGVIFNVTRTRRRRCAIVHTFHGHVLEGYFGPVISTLVRTAERMLARVTDRIVTISARQRVDIVDRFRIASGSKTVVVPLGLDLALLLRLRAHAPDFRKALTIDAGAVVVGYVGRMVPIKDLPTLVRSFAAALLREPNLWLMLVGDGSVRDELERLSKEAGIAGRVRLLGWTDDLPRVYATLDICALSSLNEGTPVALIEAMAAGKAVVATSVGGVPDVIENGTTGILVPPQDVRALSDAIVRLAADRQERRRMGAAAREHVSVRYAPERLVADIERLYASALAEKRGS